MSSDSDLVSLNREIVACRRCPRLRAYCRKIAREKRAGYRHQDYYGKPVPHFLPPHPAEAIRLLIVGLAPGAHGANRTGRMFTGDRSGDFLFRALCETGLASQPQSTHADDGLELRHTLITAALHCAPPYNKPTSRELTRCARHLESVFDRLTELRVVVCLGRIAADAVLRLYQAKGWITARAPYRFAHGAEHRIPGVPGVPGAPMVLCSYHLSQQNTFTGKLTAAMLRAVFHRAKVIAQL